jgi:hypothetical protein
MHQMRVRAVYVVVFAIFVVAIGSVVLMGVWASSPAPPAYSQAAYVAPEADAPAGQTPPTAQDAAFTMALENSLASAVGPDYTLEYVPYALKYEEASPSRKAGWRRSTLAKARAAAAPEFAVYMRFEFDSNSPELDPAEVRRLTKWRKIVESVPASRRLSFMDVVALRFGNAPSDDTRHVNDIIKLPKPGPGEVTGLPKGVRWQTGYRILWETDDQLRSGPATIAWNPATDFWVAVDPYYQGTTTPRVRKR